MKCPDCNGEGWTWQRFAPESLAANVRATCMTCEGEGEIYELPDVVSGIKQSETDPEKWDVLHWSRELAKKVAGQPIDESEQYIAKSVLGVIEWYQGNYNKIKRLYNHYRSALITAVTGLKEMHDPTHEQKPDLAGCDICQLLQAIADAQNASNNSQ